MRLASSCEGERVRVRCWLCGRVFSLLRALFVSGRKKKSAAGGCAGRIWKPFVDAAANPTNVRFEPVEDLKPFALELLSYFESPPLQEAIGNRDVISVLKAAIPVWKAETL